MDERREILAAVLGGNTEVLAALERDHARMVEASLDSNADDEHDPEGATIAFEREQLTAALTRTRAARERILAATAELEAGRYGVCVTCGRPIAVERLRARPLATECIDCARLRPR
ncbi:TraR/DksA family transcriptional regulator [Kineosporia sp. J2-2]|uniref:TraR/DksA family transcriptional regulator n=1 Tax=Kineosporia corallincola TaxID=2835133 RepID=A0ABS5TJQ5_9ACTN|nr:TraR/DksA family transcriptional regulator [Kineosporia corallincola]MBT0771306.1 TraR/DksA family transcriptional regulator [Kineosporia corallincola]